MRPGVNEDALGGGRLAGVNVRGDADVPRRAPACKARFAAFGDSSACSCAHRFNKCVRADQNKSAPSKVLVRGVRRESCYLPAEVGEGLVGLSHLVNVVALADCVALALIGFHDFSGGACFIGMPLRASAKSTNPAQARARPGDPPGFPSGT